MSTYGSIAKNLLLFYFVVLLLNDVMYDTARLSLPPEDFNGQLLQASKQWMMEAPIYNKAAFRLPCVSLNSGSGKISTSTAQLTTSRSLHDMLEKQIFIVMPAKAAGTSLKEFTKKCLKHNFPDNFLNNPALVRDSLTSSYELPSIIASHLYVGEQPLVDLIKHASLRDTLIIYVHREETERLLSGIKQVLSHLVCNEVKYKIRNDMLETLNIFKNQTHCILDEKPVVSLIEQRVQEIGMGAPEILTCRTYESVKENAPNMVFMNFKQANKLQKVLAKHHCPELLAEGVIVEANLARKKSRTVFLRPTNTKEHQSVHLDDWLSNKRGLLEWSLRLKIQILEVGPAILDTW